MSHQSDRCISLVSDSPSRSRELEGLLCRAFHVQTTDLAEDAEASRNEYTVVVDADLSNPRTIGRLKELNAAAFYAANKYFVIDEKSTTASMQANALGARGLIRRSRLCDDTTKLTTNLKSTLLDSIWTNVGDDTRKTLSGIDELNDGLYRAVAEGAPLPRDQVDENCDNIISNLSEEVLSDWLDAVRQHHSYTYRHSMIVSGLGISFAQALGMRRVDIERLGIAALMHDVGKMRIPLGILDKPDVLSLEEREAISKHPVFGAEILRSDGQFSDEVIDITLHHHELLDGSGYPDGLKGNEISDPVRILTVVDVFSALIDERSYKDAIPCDQAYDILVGMDGKLDQDIVRVFEPTAAKSALQNSQNRQPEQNVVSHD